MIVAACPLNATVLLSAVEENPNPESRTMLFSGA
jgi:hypothetical protein